MFKVSRNGYVPRIGGKNACRANPTNLRIELIKTMVSCRLSRPLNQSIEMCKTNFRWSHPLPPLSSRSTGHYAIPAGLVTSPSSERTCTSMRNTHQSIFQLDLKRGLRKVDYCGVAQAGQGTTVAREQETEKASSLTIFHFHCYVKVSSDI